MTGKCLRQVEHIRGYLRDRYSICYIVDIYCFDIYCFIFAMFSITSIFRAQCTCTIYKITYNYIPLLYLHSNHLLKQQYVFSLNCYTFLFPLDDYCVSSRVFDVCDKSTGRLLCI